MRIAGDSDGCREAARQLLRCAASVAHASQELRAAREAAGPWTGRAGQGWAALALGQAGWVDERAERLAGAGRCLSRFADELDALQADAAGLTAEAAAAGLLLDDAGRIPVVLFSLDPDRLQDALRREDVRRRLVARAGRLREEERAVHARLGRGLAALREDRWSPPRAADAPGIALELWPPSGWEAPPVLLAVGRGAAQVSSALPAALRSAPGVNVAGATYGVVVDLAQDKGWSFALTKAAAISVPSVIAFGAVAAGVVTAPVSIPAVVAATVVGIAVGYTTGRLMDAYGHRLPWVQQPKAVARPVAGRPARLPTQLPKLTPSPPAIGSSGAGTPQPSVRLRPAPVPGPAPSPQLPAPPSSASSAAPSSAAPSSTAPSPSTAGR